MNQDILIQKYLHDKCTKEEKAELDIKMNGIFEGVIRAEQAIIRNNQSLLPDDKAEMMIQYFEAIPLSSKLRFYNVLLMTVHGVKE